MEIRRRLGYVRQEPGFHLRFTAFEFVDYVAILKELDDRRARHVEVRWVLEVGRKPLFSAMTPQTSTPKALAKTAVRVSLEYPGS